MCYSSSGSAQPTTVPIQLILRYPPGGTQQLLEGELYIEVQGMHAVCKIAMCDLCTTLVCV